MQHYMEPIAIWMVNLHVAVEVETVMWLPSHFWMQFGPVQNIKAWEDYINMRNMRFTFISILIFMVHFLKGERL